MEGNKFATGRIAAEDFTFNVLFAACFAVLLMIYMAFSTKYFVVSTIGFIIAMSSSSIVINLMQYTDLAIFDQSLHPAATVLLGIFFIIIGAVLEYGISLLIYKVPVSKYAQMNSLRKKM